MSTVLEVNPGEIKEAVRRDRCDWLASIYNLLVDQPEGRNILQKLITDDPEEQLVDAAHYQGSMEHFRLSQAGRGSPQISATLEFYLLHGITLGHSTNISFNLGSIN